MKRISIAIILGCVTAMAVMAEDGLDAYRALDDFSSGNHRVVDLECGDYFEYPQLTAWDACDGDITEHIVIGGDVVNPNLPGDYVVTYNVTDSAGNAADEATRTIQVMDGLAPVITLFGGNPVAIAPGERFTDPGVTAFDACDGDLTDRIVVEGAVNPHISGAYTIAYKVADGAGNLAEAMERLVYVGGAIFDVAPLADIVLQEGAYYLWGEPVKADDANFYQWYRYDGQDYVPVVDGAFDGGIYVGGNRSALSFEPFSVAMAGNYMLEISDNVATVQRMATVSIDKDSELPATGLFGLAAAAVALAIAGAATTRRRRK